MVKIKYSKELDLLPPRPLFFPNLFECVTFCLPKPMMMATPQKQAAINMWNDDEDDINDDVYNPQYHVSSTSKLLLKDVQEQQQDASVTMAKDPMKRSNMLHYPSSGRNRLTNHDEMDLPMLDVSESASDYDGDEFDDLLDNCDFLSFQQTATATNNNNNKFKTNNKFGGIAIGFCQIIFTLLVMEQFWQLSRRRYWG